MSYRTDYIDLPSPWITFKKGASGELVAWLERPAQKTGTSVLIKPEIPFYPDILAAVSREHLESSLPDPSKAYNVKRVYKALMKESRKDREPDWPRNPLPVFALCQFVTNKPLYINRTMWIRDAALVAIDLRTMRRPSELCKIKLNDIKFCNNLCWVRISTSKTDQFSNGRFIPIEMSNNLYCPVKLLINYLKICPKTPANWPLFLSKTKKQMSVGAISAVVKRMAEHAHLTGCYTAHSIRIGGATTAMEAGFSLTQIRAIGGWDSKAVMLYLRSIGTAQLEISKKM
ncbi:7007_t:CDS:2, partial [Scutellospora calospora]